DAGDDVVGCSGDAIVDFGAITAELSALRLRELLESNFEIVERNLQSRIAIRRRPWRGGGGDFFCCWSSGGRSRMSLPVVDHGVRFIDGDGNVRFRLLDVRALIRSSFQIIESPLEGAQSCRKRVSRPV